MECRNYIVTTTISSPTEATKRFLEKKGWKMIIVGDLKTPHEEYKELAERYPNLSYLHPDYQEEHYKRLSDAIGWNKIQRRNIGFCEAYVRGVEIMATVDDDNIPYDNWGQNLYIGEEIIAHCWKSENGVFDPLSVTNVNYMWHRGYPCELIPTRNNVKYMGKKKIKPLVQADLWDGVPDIDAMNRIIFQPRIKLEAKTPFWSENIAPFNSQNTFVAREIIPYYMMLPFVGRMDDIWPSYIVQKKFPNSVIFNEPTVYQERHEPLKRNMKDMRDELLGYEYSLQFINEEYALPEEAAIAYEAYTQFFDGLFRKFGI